ncbi:MAG: hypothetical protein JNK04_10355 [Myxococcales bacterium]|nr:hypothetical protein [Myxococcales bacterium]
MIEDSPTMEAESAMVLDGLAVGVDHLESIVVFLLSVAIPYATWVRPGSDLRPPRVADGMRNVYLAAEAALRAFEGDVQVRAEHPSVTLESSRHLILVHRVRTFGVACSFAREVPLGFARMAARQIVATLEQDLPYPQEEPPAVQIPSHAKPTMPGAPPAQAQLDFEAIEPAPDTVPPRSSIGDRVRTLVSHLESVAFDPHVVRLRVALRTGLGLEALVHPDQLNNDALVLIETAAEDILGLERGKLAEVARS